MFMFTVYDWLERLYQCVQSMKPAFTQYNFDKDTDVVELSNLVFTNPNYCHTVQMSFEYSRQKLWLFCSFGIIVPFADDFGKCY